MILSVREGFPREETWMSVASHVLHFEKLVAFVSWTLERSLYAFVCFCGHDVHFLCIFCLLSH